MLDRRAIARTAVAAALRVRRAAGYELEHAICVYDLAARLGVEVRFLDIPSMEGMYFNTSSPTIIISSLRPPGRQAFTCAHELAHHSQGETVRIDELVGQVSCSRPTTREFMADCFAGALLMPKMAVSRAFALRGWSARNCTPAQVFMVAGYFGVGYSTLIHHMRRALQILPGAHGEALLKVGPQKAQALLLGWETPDHVCVVDAHWVGRAIDIEVGDSVLYLGDARVEGLCVEEAFVTKAGPIFHSVRPGVGRLNDSSGWSAFVRVSRRDYVGRSLYRHWEEPADG